MKTVRITLAAVVAAGLATFVWTAFVGAQEAAALQQKDPPPDGVWTRFARPEQDRATVIRAARGRGTAPGAGRAAGRTASAAGLRARRRDLSAHRADAVGSRPLRSI